MSGDALESLKTPPPSFSNHQASALLKEFYGVSAELKVLISERDQNFLAKAEDGSKYVFKIANAAEDPAVTDFQNRALQHIAKTDSQFPVPRVVPTVDGDLMFEAQADNGSSHQVRLLSWLDGIPLSDAEGDSDFPHQAGSCLARLGLALRDFRHPADDYPLLWDIKRADRLANLLQYVSDKALRDQCESRVSHFRENVKPLLASLRSQVIYNDLNPSNVLVAADDVNQVTGVIDFGDAIYAPLVNDVAIAAAYLCHADMEDPYADILRFLAAYTAITPLSDDEIALLPELIRARHLTTVLITHWRVEMYPENRDYILRNEVRARRMLEFADGISFDTVIARFRDACHQEQR